MVLLRAQVAAQFDLSTSKLICRQSKRLPQPATNDRESDDRVAWDLQAEVHHRMQQADERNGERRQGNDAIPAAAQSGADQKRQNNDPREPNGGGEREAEVGGEFERCAMGKVPYPTKGSFSASVARKTPNKGSKTGAEPRMVGDHVQGRAIGVEAAFIGKVLRIETLVHRSAQDLHQEKGHAGRAGPQHRQAASFGQVTTKEEREGDDKGQEDTITPARDPDIKSAMKQLKKAKKATTTFLRSLDRKSCETCFHCSGPSGSRSRMRSERISNQIAAQDPK